jgi:hypothetical protein
MMFVFISLNSCWRATAAFTNFAGASPANLTRGLDPPPL